MTHPVVDLPTTLPMNPDLIIGIAFGANVVLGSLFVLLTYVSMERSIKMGVLVSGGVGIGTTLLEYWIGSQLHWPSWDLVEMAGIAAVIGAIVGILLVVLTLRPEVEEFDQGETNQAEHASKADRENSSQTDSTTHTTNDPW